jgi:chromosome segregation ATPase
MSLVELARTGLREMPSNASWLLDQIRDSTSAVRDQARRLGEAVVEVVPAGGDNIEVRIQRVQDAAEQAREAEHRALEAAQEAKECSDRALRLANEAEHGSRRPSGRSRGRAEIEDAATEAELAQRRAEELVEDAQAKIADARRLAEEAAERARLASEEAQRYARQPRRRGAAGIYGERGEDRTGRGTA